MPAVGASSSASRRPMAWTHPSNGVTTSSTKGRCSAHSHPQSEHIKVPSIETTVPGSVPSVPPLTPRAATRRQVSSDYVTLEPRSPDRRASDGDCSIWKRLHSQVPLRRQGGRCRGITGA
jgi:hypothetical protein